MRWIILLVALTASTWAEVAQTTLEYRDGKTVLEGAYSVDSASKTPRPGIVIFHQWAGPTEHERRFADRLAAEGYAVLIADVYGRGVRPETTEARREEVMKYAGDRPLMRSRAKSALFALAGQPGVDPTRIVALGFCFGGMVSLELARSGADLKGAVSFHGGLNTPDPADARQIKGKILVLHGADDPYVKPDEVAAFEKEMRDAGVDWQFIAYGGAVHAFTQKDAGDDPATGVAYNEAAARRSWDQLRLFLAEVFQ